MGKVRYMLARRSVLTAASLGLLAMQRHHVPATSLIVLRHGAIVERLSIGADGLTHFQAASISRQHRFRPTDRG
jgi:hypothetical protein